MNNQNNVKENMIPKLTLFINAKFRSLGIKAGNEGYKLIVKAILIKVIEDDEDNFEKFEVIYDKLSSKINRTPKQIADNIYYALNHRNNSMSKENFEKIFGYSYDRKIFTNKEFIEEFVNIIRIKTAIS